MHASTHAFGLNAPADFSLPRSRETAGAAPATAVARVERRVCPRRIADGLVGQRSRLRRVHYRLGSRVENALFAITLVALGGLWLGACSLPPF